MCLKQNARRDGAYYWEVWIFIPDDPIYGFASILEHVHFKKINWWLSRIFEIWPFREVSLVSPLYSASLKEHSQLHNENDIKRSLYWGWKIRHLSITWELCFKLKVTVKCKASSKHNCWFLKQNVFCFMKVFLINIHVSAEGSQINIFFWKEI